MSSLVATFTSDPSLMRCELARVRAQVDFPGDGAVAGVGAFEENVVLLQRYGAGVPLGNLWESPDSEVMLAHAGRLPVGQPMEENAQPFRFRHWLFAHSGVVTEPVAVRERLVSQLPEFLQRAVRGASVGEAVFAHFLARLRELGRMEDPHLEASAGAAALLATARAVDLEASKVRGADRPELGLVATNGKVLVAARTGAAPLYYRLLEGDGACERCGLDGKAKDTDGLTRAHRRRKSVVIASKPSRASSWVELGQGQALAVDRRLEVSVL